MNSASRSDLGRQVSITALPAAEYPETESQTNEIISGLQRLADDLHWSAADGGPLGGVIPAGARVLVKPNFVLHQNHGPWGMLPLITHPSIVKAIVGAALQAEPEQVMVGDAPLQSCDFANLMETTGLGQWAERLGRTEPRFKGIRDFRRTVCGFTNGVRVAEENLQPEDRFVLFDLGSESLLEPISDPRSSFRVTCYDPRLLSRTHAPGRHQYLIARPVLEADVIINLPKLKTHKKAGVTCALKNLIGINGNKEFLPHHRIGGAEAGGDCYPGGSRLKRTLEYSLDRQNMAGSMTSGRLWNEVALNLNRFLKLMGDEFGTEGSWSGNDTIWRTCLDLNRILLYGRADGTMADTPQRRVINIVDSVIAGQGDGPLSPQPLPLGLLAAGENSAAVDWVAASLLGYDSNRIPIAREAFSQFRWPLAPFGSNEVIISGDLGAGRADELFSNRTISEHVSYPLGWRNAIRMPKMHLAQKTQPQMAESVVWEGRE